MKKSKYSYDQIRKLQMEGHSQVAIARILGISQSWLSGKCNKNSSKDYRFRIFEQPIDRRYWQSEDEIVQSLEVNYLPEQLSGWELDQFRNC